MANFRVGVVDGTGAWNDGDYQASMTNSFCRQIFDAIGEPNANYLRGPSNDGLSVRTKAYTIADWITDELKRARRPFPIYLAGYSRGASAVVYAAELLQDRKIEVDGLFLFDAVARHVWSELGGTLVPRNVKLTVHAIRAENPDMVRAFEGTINGGLGNPIRPWFGHVALSGLGARFISREFQGSHGALGGVGWTHVKTADGKTDEDCQKAVAAFMNPELQRAVGVALVSHKPTNEPSTGATTRVVGALDRFAMDPKAPLKAGYDALKSRLK